MFLGTFTPKLDDKGRFFLPAKFRDKFERGMVTTRQADRCLAIWPAEVFAAEVERSTTGPSSSAKVRDFQRMVSAGASDESPDSQGRLTVPPSLRQYAGLTKDIVVIGAYDRLEVWDAARWEEYSAQREEAFAALDDSEAEPG